ncbi:hypothetical protein A3K29_05520 [Candidatus Collierbacteria bacterium RIFOXYB2_FULL_46_14]|nr:MAG: hypothetical protein A3K29_05520 [Candidatus Collierbacteria bacterium RIFOXYB2_FULL_46_14]OGD76592.1 MAG: hypothetical protein A3K43_05520 [Candidatus Collierbacteria bacterium RIFOXYA2_FULL_46_20]OGD77928.1 MAG: hypothetical protein A3K39_05520 [Candidatus Collierbacteria bacterium RIFOXYC2_FULL_43_15]OGD81219.1 MAG: hypothetical protein A2320_06020 [Pseudomonadales bacterium GWC2_63_15]OGD82650.1 MAG: hypothetical protein A3K36_05520 [Candidatus Collierbacteria bacterium RIFOXYD2_FUL
MIIEFTNAVPPKGHSAISVAIVVASCAFFFIPTSLIILGYLSSQPTGSLISPLPQGVLSQTPAQPSPTITPLIAAPQETPASTESSVLPSSNSNITDKTATISAGLYEISVADPDIKTTSQIYLSPRDGDKSIYSVKSKQDGQMVISINSPSDTVRYVDYHIVNP